MNFDDPFADLDNPPALQGPTHVLQIDLSHMPIDQLLALRQEIDQRLPARSLKDIDMAHELVLQMLALQGLQKRVMDDPNIPANQIAQVANSLSASLTTLAKLQMDIYGSERLKKVEAILIQSLQELPEDQQESFMLAYEAALGAVG